MHVFGHMRSSLFVLAAILAGCGGGEHGGSKNAATVINGVQVPADPEQAARATVVGVDVNANGVRDEVERALARSYGADPSLYAVSMTLARSLQTIIQQSSEATAPSAQSLIQAQQDAFRCAAHNAGLQRATEISTEVTLRTFNTKERMRERRRIDQAAGTFEIQARGSETCQ